jgi:hypothetical protein
MVDMREHRLVDDLLREQVFDRGGEVIDLEPLTPAAIDVVKHPLKGPQPAEQPMYRFAVEAVAAEALDYPLYRRGAAFVPALADQLSGEVFSWQFGHDLRTHPEMLPIRSTTQPSFPRRRESSEARTRALALAPAFAGATKSRGTSAFHMSGPYGSNTAKHLFELKM